METVSGGVKRALAEADQALSSAEEILELKPVAPEILPMVQSAAGSLLKAFIHYRGETPIRLELQSLWQQCVSLEPEFLELQETLECLSPDSPADDWDAEDFSEILDAANEVWDFTVGFLPEACLP